jgi:hypothetical protein
MRPARSSLTFLPLLAALLLAGCASYKLGAPAKLPFETIHVTLAEDRSLTPQVRALLTGQIIEELQRSGRVQVVSDPAAADAILSVTLVSTRRSGSVGNPADTGRPLKVDTVYSALANLRSRDGSTFWLRNTEIRADRFVLLEADQGLTNAEFIELSTAIRALAERTAAAVLGVW